MAPPDFPKGNADHRRRSDKNDQPAWTDSIRALYDGVSQEPLPADLEKLLIELGKAIK